MPLNDDYSTFYLFTLPLMPMILLVWHQKYVLCSKPMVSQGIPYRISPKVQSQFLLLLTKLLDFSRSLMTPNHFCNQLQLNLEKTAYK